MAIIENIVLNGILDCNPLTQCYFSLDLITYCFQQLQLVDSTCTACLHYLLVYVLQEGSVLVASVFGPFALPFPLR